MLADNNTAEMQLDPGLAIVNQHDDMRSYLFPI